MIEDKSTRRAVTAIRGQTSCWVAAGPALTGSEEERRGKGNKSRGGKGRKEKATKGQVAEGTDRITLTRLSGQTNWTPVRDPP